MESNTIQFPTTREYLLRLAINEVDKVLSENGADKALSDLGNGIGCFRMLDESDRDFRKRVMETRNGFNR